jgi:hypothetical protein
LRPLLVFVIVLSGVLTARGQDLSPFADAAYEVIRLTPEAGPSFPLPAFLRPNTISVEVNDVLLSNEYYDVREGGAVLRVEPSVLDTTHSLRVAYRTFPVGAIGTVSLLDTARTHDAYRLAPPTPPAPTATAPSPPSSTLQSRGSISRGVTAGSNRDVGLESGLRVELSGEVAPGVTIRALLNDENTPILPDGTTRRLEDFDRVFIELRSPVGEVQLGDVALRLQQSEFARLTRSVQGAAVRSSIGGGADDRFGGQVVAAGAISRGQFQSMEVRLIDGVQGPYRLTGAEGERFILVVPGSERVYWDGVLLERGDQLDYTIDYATGELYFTSRRLVTDERRALVEFEYSTNQFTRTLIATQAEAFFLHTRHGPRVRIGGAVIREADGSQFLDEFGLSREDSLALAQAGDSPALRPGAEEVRFDAEAAYVQYVRRVVEGPSGDRDTAYVALSFRPEEGEPVYRVRFSHVGLGMGSYERGGEGVNGIMYRFVGSGQGSYEPVRVLPRPVAQQVFDVFGSVAIVPNVEVFGEWARSDFDRNTLSALDAINNVGNAVLAGMRLRPTRIADRATLSGQLQRRTVGATFSSFDRIRPVEFERHWNLGTGATASGATSDFERHETTDIALLHLLLDGGDEVTLESGRLMLGDTFEGWRFGGSLALNPASLPGINYTVEHIESRDEVARRDGRWFRQRGLLQYGIGSTGATPFLEFEHENRAVDVAGTDSLALDSFHFVRVRPGLRWSREDLGTGDASLSVRRDSEWFEGALHPASRSLTAALAHAISPTADFSAEMRVGYRHRAYTETFRALGRTDQSSLLMQAQGRWRPHPQAVELTASYDATGDRTPLLQEVFVRVGPEYGSYVWEDFNGDGIIQPDEMIPERTPNEGMYTRTFVPSDSLIATTTVSARAQLRLDGFHWREKEGLRRIASIATSRTTVEILETTRDPDLARIYLLYLTRYRHPANTVNGRLRVGQDVAFFPRSRVGTIDLGFNHIETMTSRTGGRDERLMRQWRAEGRLRAIRGVSLRNEVAFERNRYRSDAFATRRFDISGIRVEPEVSISLLNNLQAVSRLPLAWKTDAVGDRSSRLLRAPLELRYQRPGLLSATARAEVAHVSLEGEALGLAEFELTDGRGPGTSYLWGLGGQYQLNEYLRATLQYDGRLPEGRRAIHTMRMQLSAVF